MYIFKGTKLNKIFILGVLPLSTHYAIVLFDMGVSHSFISTQFVRDHNLGVESVEEEWQIHLPSGETILTNQICKDCKVDI